MSLLPQYKAARESALIADRSRLGTIEMIGADRLSFLHALLTNDIARLQKGSGVYAAYLTPQGRMISDMRVIETGDRVLLRVEPDVASSLAARFDALVFSEDVQVRDRSGEVAAVGVYGPQSVSLISRALGMDLSELSNEHDNVAFGVGVAIRDESAGVPGFEIVLPVAERGAVWTALIGAGGVAGDQAVLEILRIEAGRPRFGVDMDTETIPLEAGLERRAISFEKGCYVGQEVIVRVMHRGHGRVARRLVRLVMADGTKPEAGSKIFVDGKESGEITSSAEIPTTGRAIALGYLHRDAANAGIEVTVNGLRARVDQLID